VVSGHGFPLAPTDSFDLRVKCDVPVTVTDLSPAFGCQVWLWDGNAHDQRRWSARQTRLMWPWPKAHQGHMPTTDTS